MNENIINQKPVNVKLEGTSHGDQRKLLDLGYEVIPIKGKFPRYENWTLGEITPDRLTDWQANNPDHKSTGIRTGRFAVADIDLWNATHATVASKAIQGVLGPTLLDRRGSKGMALCYFNTEPIRKITVSGLPPGKDKLEKVEFLGAGQQLAAFGIHPDTGKAYRWMAASPLDFALNNLPEVTPEGLRKAALAVYQTFIGLGYTRVAVTGAGMQDHQSISREELTPVAPEWLVKMFNTVSADGRVIGQDQDRVEWIGWLAVWKYTPLVDAKTGEPVDDFDRFEAFNAWCAEEGSNGYLRGAYTDDKTPNGYDSCLTAWLSMSDVDKRVDGKTIRSLVKLAKEYGYTGPTFFNDIAAVPDTPAIEKFIGATGDESASPVDSVEVPDGSEVYDWFAPVAALNDRFAIVTGGKHAGLTADLSKPREPHFLITARFHAIHAHMRVTPPPTLDNPKPKPTPISRIWETWEGRREITGVVFIPPGAGKPPSGAHNLWQGFAVEPKEGKAHERFIRHVRDTVCGGDEDAFEWLITWLTDLVQNPGYKPGAAVALIGEQGVGKTIFYRFLKEIFGTHAASVSDPNKVIGNFNAHMAGLVVLGVEEGFWAGDKRAEAKLRDMITSPTMNLEQKGVDSIEIANHVHVLVTSNERWVVPIAFDDRRWTVFDVLPTRKHDREFWQKIHEDLEGDGPANLLHYLLGRTNSPRHVLFTPYQTKAKTDQATETMDSVSQWWLDVLRGDCNPGLGGTTSQEDSGRPDGIFGVDTRKSVILSSYQGWCADNPRLYRLTPNAFWRTFRGVVNGCMRIHKPRASEGKTRHAYTWFAPRETCQGAFAERLQAEWTDLE